MAGNKVLLDTNIVSALFNGEILIANKIDEAKEVYIPVIVLGELYYGAGYSTHIRKNTANIITLSETYPAIAVDIETARIYGSIKAALRKQGTPIPENDIWIAALCQQHSLLLITRDGHFDNIKGLHQVKW